MSPAHTLTIHTQAGDIDLPAQATVADALAHPRLAETLGSQGAGAVATALNGQFVPRDQRAHHPLAHGDTLLCFQAITGG